MSLLDGAIKIPSLCDQAVASGQTAVAITDHGWIAGAVKFVQAAKDRNIKPIVGMETYLATGASRFTPAKTGGDNYHLTLLAKNKEGYRNLVRLTSLAHTEGLSYKPRIDHDLLLECRRGLVVLSGCIGAEIPQTIIDSGEPAGLELARKYAAAFGEDFFIEVMYHGAHKGIDHTHVERAGQVYFTESDLNAALVRIANNLGVGLVATNDAHYLTRGNGDHHDTLLCIGMGAWKDKPDRMRFNGAKHQAWEFYIKTESEMLGMVREGWWHTACANTAIIADSIEEDVVPLGMNILPKYNIPNDPEFQAWLALRSTTKV
jgi:DNA polymerase-3 subunit alpha